MLKNQDQLKYFFDVLRAISILGVCLSHIVQTFTTSNDHFLNEAAYQTFYLGRFGVEAFFFLSGCLMCHLYSNNSQTQISNRGIIVKRFARIYPLWLLFFLVYVLQASVFSRGNWILAQNKMSNVFNEFTGIVLSLLTLLFLLWIFPPIFDMVIPGGWSIQIEIFHYLIFLFVRKKSTIFICIIGIFSNLICLVLINQSYELISNLQKILMSFTLNSTFWYFASGIFLVKAIQQVKKGVKTIEIVKKYSLKLTLYVTYSLSTFALPLYSGPHLLALIFLFSSIMASWLISGTIVPRKIAQMIAKYSYFMYFFHFIQIKLIERYSLSNYFSDVIGYYCVLYLVIIMISGLPTAFLSHKYFEMPIRKYLNTYAK
jgi:peptidoglycan/LPS O-acetylase OafA/YrhL